MISISNKDAAIIQALLERGHKFYRAHAVRSPDQNDARLMAKMAKKLKNNVNRAAAMQQPQIIDDND